MTMQEGESTGRRLFASALVGGAQALQRPIGALAVGLRADIVLLDGSHPDLASRHGDQWLDAWTFVVGRTGVKTVLVGGEIVVEAGRHRMWPAIEGRYKTAIANLSGSTRSY
jgi:cytosine/adenosine deaminase-related metal-dependent hydrolase